MAPLTPRLDKLIAAQTFDSLLRVTVVRFMRTTKKPMHPTKENIARRVCLDGNIFVQIIGFQNGVPIDVLERLEEISKIILMPMHSNFIRLPLDFRELNCCPTKCLPTYSHSKGLFVNATYRDARLPLHLAIVEGEIEVVKRLFKYKPELFTMDALFCAIHHLQFSIALWLIPLLTELFPDCPHNYELQYKFDFNIHYTDDRDEHVGWYLCADALGFKVPFKQDDKIVEIEDVQKYLQRPEAIARKALKTNNLNEFKKVLPQLYDLENIMNEASGEGKIDFLDAIVSHVPENHDLDLSDICSNAPIKRMANVFELFHRKFAWNGLRINSQFFATLAELGYLDVLRWLYDHQNIQCTDLLIYKKPAPLRLANIEVVKFLAEISWPMDQIWPLNLEVAKYLVDNHVKITEQHLLWAIGGSLQDRRELGYYRLDKKYLVDICKFYHTNFPNLKFTDEHIELGLRLGDVKFVQFVHENNIGDLTSIHMKIALLLNYYDVVKYLHQITKIDFPNEGLSWAIRSLRKENEYSHEVRSQTDASKSPLIEYIVTSNKDREWEIIDEPSDCTSETLIWLIENCKGSNKWEVLHRCVRFGSVEILSFVVDRTSTTPEVIEMALDNAIDTGSMIVLGYLWNLAIQAWQKNGACVQTKCKTRLEILENLKTTKMHLTLSENTIKRIQATIYELVD